MAHAGGADFSLLRDGADAYIAYGSWHNFVSWHRLPVCFSAARGPALRRALVCTHRTFTKGRSIFSLAYNRVHTSSTAFPRCRSPAAPHAVHDCCCRSKSHAVLVGAVHAAFLVLSFKQLCRHLRNQRDDIQLEQTGLHRLFSPALFKSRCDRS